MEILVPDVVKQISVVYASSHGPLLRLACREWRQLLQRHVNTNPTSLSTRGNLARYGHRDLLALIVASSRINMGDVSVTTMSYFEEIMCGGARGGHYHIFEDYYDKMRHSTVKRLFYYPVRHIEDWIQHACVSAARGGYAGLVDLMANRWRIKNPSAVMAYAARGGHVNLVGYCRHEFDTRDVNWAFALAARGGHERLMRLLHEKWGADNVDRAMGRAAEGGHEHLVRLCKEQWGATRVYLAMKLAARNGFESIVQLCHDTYGCRQVEHVNAAMLEAGRNGHSTIVRRCKEQWGATANVSMAPQ